MRTTLLSFALAIIALLMIGCSKEDPAESQEASTPPSTSTGTAETAVGDDQPQASMTDGDLSINPNAKK